MSEALQLRWKGENPHLAAGTQQGAEHSDERLAHSQVDLLCVGPAILLLPRRSKGKHELKMRLLCDGPEIFLYSSRLGLLLHILSACWHLLPSTPAVVILHFY